MSLVTIDVPARVLVYSNIYGLLFYMRSYRNVRIGDDDSDDQRLCVMEYKALKSFCQGLVQQVLLYTSSLMEAGVLQEGIKISFYSSSFGMISKKVL